MRYIALLRGINVGGNNRVPMADLRTCLSDMGLDNVRTYIQSGNVIFDAIRDDAVPLTAEIEQAIRANVWFPSDSSTVQPGRI